jgi:hypothetical protein
VDCGRGGTRTREPSWNPMRQASEPDPRALPLMWALSRGFIVTSFPATMLASYQLQPSAIWEALPLLTTCAVGALVVWHVKR